MYPLLLLVLVFGAAGVPGVYSHPAAAGTPAAQFWSEALPGTPMPESIADLVQEGIDHSPLVEHSRTQPIGVDNINYKKATTSWSDLTQQSDDNINYKKATTSWSDLTQLSDDNINYKITPTSWAAQTPPTQSGGIKINYVQPSSSSSDKAATAAVLPAGLFFSRAQLHLGSIMTVLFKPAAVPPILPRAVAEEVPFGNNLEAALTRFSIAPGSAAAAAVAETISLCQAPAQLPGEQKACATSLEATIQSAMDILGIGSSQGAQGKAAAWAASSALPRAGLPLQRYVVQAVAPLDGDRHVGCHSMAYPYAVYYCHDTGSPTSAYVVSLRSQLSGGGGPQQLTMATICHLDTSKWDPGHPAFKMTNTQPGGEPVCHFMSYSNLLFGLKGASKP